MFPKAELKKNDKNARIIIIIVSAIIFIGITILSKVEIGKNMDFNSHIFASLNATINSIVTLMLIAGLIAVKNKKYNTHKNIMKTCIFLSILFLLSYIAHHLFAGETRYGDYDGNGIVSEIEKEKAGQSRYAYLFLLLTHIPLAGIILPVILFTAYRALSGDYTAHKKLARIAWPLWFYVTLSGVIIYLMIEPFYKG